MIKQVNAWMIVTTLLFLTGCLPTSPVVDLKAAENIRKTSDGRIFVTGREGLFELRRNEAGAFQTVFVATSENGCTHHAGLAQLHDWLFFVCVRQSGFSLKTLKFTEAGELLAYSLMDGRVVPVGALGEYQFPNGLDALASEDAILIADEDFIRGEGGVSKARIDFSTDTPLLVDYQHHWINAQHGVGSANGVRVVEGDIYVTNLGRFGKIALDGNGEPTTVKTLYRTTSVLDDFDVVCDGFLVTDFVKGRLVYIPRDGSPAIKTPAGFSTPSAVLGMATPMFEAGEILVTESTGLSPGSRANRIVKIQPPHLGIAGCPAAQ